MHLARGVLACIALRRRPLRAARPRILDPRTGAAAWAAVAAQEPARPTWFAVGLALAAVMVAGAAARGRRARGRRCDRAGLATIACAAGASPRQLPAARHPRNALGRFSFSIAATDLLSAPVTIGSRCRCDRHGRCGRCGGRSRPRGRHIEIEDVAHVRDIETAGGDVRAIKRLNVTFSEGVECRHPFGLAHVACNAAALKPWRTSERWSWATSRLRLQK